MNNGMKLGYAKEYDERMNLIFNDIVGRFNRPPLWISLGAISILNSLPTALLKVIKEQFLRIMAIPDPVQQFNIMISIIDNRMEGSEM